MKQPRANQSILKEISPKYSLDMKKVFIGYKRKMGGMRDTY